MKETISNTMIELPLLLKYKVKAPEKHRLYMVAGMKPGIDIGKGKNGKTQQERALSKGL